MFERSRPSSTKAAAAVVDIGMEVIAFLVDQGLDATPANYELGYAYRTGRQSLVARAVDAITMSGERLNQMQVNDIIEAHLRATQGDDPDERSRMRQQTLQLADLAAGAAAATGQFGRDLSVGLKVCDGSGPDLTSVVGAMIERTKATELALAEASRQIDELRQEVEAAKGDAARDALTGLHNRRGVEAELRGLKGKQQSVVAICDVDHFKAINDRHGHTVGDRVLKLVASSIAESCDPHLVARWGGEEFIVLMNGVSLEGAVAMIERARVDLSVRNLRVRETDESLGAVTFSAGIALLNGRKFDDAVREADKLLYKAKANGRNQVAR